MEIIWDLNKILELIASIFGLAFLFLIIKERIEGWFFGIIASIINIYLMLEVKLYSESILYSYYLIMGVYGWYHWHNKSKGKIEISTISIKKHIYWIIIGVFLTFGMGFYFETQTEAELPYRDGFSTVFAFIATYLQARKYLYSWVYWIVLNAFSIYLYNSVDLNFRSMEMIIYSVMSVVGFFQWRKIYVK
jgi:nicotinamide mononucleotide transporter